MSKDAQKLVCALALIPGFLPIAVEAASYRTANFVVQAADARLAREVGDAAEQFRKDLALEWLGHELPRWQQICPITVEVAPGMPAGGETSFVFDGGEPTNWRMRVQGSRIRVLDSVLPHEVTHTIFATHFRRPLPRWADEGACTTVEHASERDKQKTLLIRFLTTQRGIPFRHMFAMKEYPRDILPLYSQGFSLARFLISNGGKQRFVKYVEEGMATENWHATTSQFYGFKDLADLQISWLDWVKVGSPDRPIRSTPATLVAQTTRTEASPAKPGASWYVQQRDRGASQTPARRESSAMKNPVPGTIWR